MTNCKYCKADCIFRGEQQTKECKGYIPMTNAARIRAKSDEELAELFGSIADDGKSCSLICGDLDKCKRNNSIERICKNHYLEWLKQLVKDGEDDG